MHRFKHRLIPALLLALAFNAQAAEPQPVSISGAIEVEMAFDKDYADIKTSDISLAALELGLDAQINEFAGAHLLLLHEDDNTEPMEIDEASINLDMTGGWNLSAGRMHVPFGVYESNMISDPLTLELGETREAAVLIGYQAAGFYGAAYAFNGDTIESSKAAGEDTIEHFGTSLGYLWETDYFSLDVGLDYISSIGDSDGISAGLPDIDGDGLPDAVMNFSDGIAFHWIYTNGDFNFIVEHVSSGSFDAAELSFNGQGASPSAYNIEFGKQFDWGTAAISFQGSGEAVALGLPESRILLTLAQELHANTFLSFEYAIDKDYAIADAGTGNNGSTATVQLALAF